MNKGESLADTMRTIESYADIVVVRHPEEGSCRIAAENIRIPLINAGDGVGEHPTQALLDLYTIYKERDFDIAQAPSKLHIAFVGDIRFGRTIHSLVQLLSQYPHIQMSFVSPKDLALPEFYKTELRARKIDFIETEDIQQIQEYADVIYMTRIQRETFPHL